MSCCIASSHLSASSDRYEKRHKNLAAHVSPAFRVDVGDVVTVGVYSRCSVILDAFSHIHVV